MKIISLLLLITLTTLLTSCTNGDADLWSQPPEGSIEPLLPAPCTVEQTDLGLLIQCQDGTSAELFHGQDGQNGENGTSCIVKPVVGTGAIIECGSGDAITTVLIRDGVDGVDGNTGATGDAGTDGVSILLEVINPCGDSELDQVILKFSDGTIVAHQSNGKNEFLTVLVPGDYQTSDGLKCPFTVTEDGNVIW